MLRVGSYFASARRRIGVQLHNIKGVMQSLYIASNPINVLYQFSFDFRFRLPVLVRVDVLPSLFHTFSSINWPCPAPKVRLTESLSALQAVLSIYPLLSYTVPAAKLGIYFNPYHTN